MKNKEFNLSEKIFREMEWIGCNSIPKKDVKEFIKRLKEDLKNTINEEAKDSPITWEKMQKKPHEHCKSFLEFCLDNLDYKIDKLAGDDLK